jgi:hypothetical protein
LHLSYKQRLTKNDEDNDHQINNNSSTNLLDYYYIYHTNYVLHGRVSMNTCCQSFTCLRETHPCNLKFHHQSTFPYHTHLWGNLYLSPIKCTHFFDAFKTNSHKLHSETGHWSIPKTPWDERVCHLCDTKKVEDEKHFLLDCRAYTHIRSHFRNIYHTSNLPYLLTQQKYGDLGNLLLMIFEHKNKIVKNHT